MTDLGKCPPPEAILSREMWIAEAERRLTKREEELTVSVKPLEWFSQQQYVLADTAFGTYRILGDTWWFENGKRNRVKNVEAAKAAVQADHEARIRSVLLSTPKPEATEGAAHEKGIEAAARTMCEAWHYAKIGTPDGDAEWKRKQGQYRKQAKAAIAAYRAALTANPETRNENI